MPLLHTVRTAPTYCAHDMHVACKCQHCQYAESAGAPQVAKNITLAGVGSLSLLDGTPCSPDAAPCNFLIPADFKASQRSAPSLLHLLNESEALQINCIPHLPQSLDPQQPSRAVMQLCSSLPQQSGMPVFCPCPGLYE